MQTTSKANNILGHFFALLGAVFMLAIGTWVSASSSEQVKPLDNLAVPRTGHTATALSDGRILITGGRDADGNLVAASEIFDPETQTSSASATLHTARVDHGATVLVDGRVLIAGGSNDSGPLSSAEIFDPANPGAGFQVVASPMTAARTRHTATLLNNGTVLIAGGETGGTAEIFDPATQSFTPTLWNLQVARNGHTATLFTDDSVLLAGGNTASLEMFTPLDQKFTLDAATLSVIRTGHWAFELSDTRLLLFQGDIGNTIDEFNPTTDTLTPKGSLDFHASSSSLLANGKVLVLGTGVSGLYNPDAVPPAPDFTAFDETSVPHSGILPRSGQSAVTLPGDKKILITGGVDGNNQLLGQALFNPAKIWTDKDDYQPDEPVILSGSGWQANEPIYLFAVDNETEQWTYEMTVNADSNGEFVLDPYFIVELRHLGVQFHVTAVGQSTMQADVYFTDASNITSATVATQDSSCTTSTTTFTQGQTVCAAVTVTGINGSGAGNFFVVWFNPSNAVDHATTESVPGTVPTLVNDTFNTAGKPAGNWSVHVCKNNTCGGNGNDVASAPFTLNACTSPSVTTQPTGQTVTYGAASATFTAAASGTPAPTVQWQVNTGSGFTNIGGATSTTLNISNPTVAMSGNQYRAVFTNSCGTATSNAATLTVNKKSLTASIVGNPTKTYDGATSATLTPANYALSGLVGTDTFTVTQTVGSYNTKDVATATTVTATLTAGQFTPGPGTVANNYQFPTSASGAGSIAKANASFTVTPYTVTYDGASNTATVSQINGVNGETGATVGTVDLSGTTHVLAVGSPYTDTWNFHGTANYNDTSGQITDVINKKDATWTTNPNSKTYGDADPVPLTTGSGSGFTSGDAAQLTVTYSRVTGETVGGGPYHITATLGPAAVTANYNITNTGANFTINSKAATWTTNPNSKAYGDADPNPLTTGSGSGFLAADNVTATYSRTSGETVTGGPYHITATLSPAAVLSNYTITNAGANFTINAKAATWTTNAASKTYGDADPNPLTTGSGSGFLAADNVTATYSRDSGETVAGGPYHITATLSPSGVLSNYAITNAGANFTINAKAATWTTNAASKTYGDADPNPLTTGSGSGFLAADNVTATYSRDSGETVAGGPYHITAMLSPTGVLSNYAITNTGANFTINAKAATWTTNANSKTYGDADPNPLTTGSGSGFLAADNVTASYGRAAGETVTGGPYHITATLAPAGVLSNYNITNAGADFTINAKNATWTTNPNSKTYGDADPNPLTTGSGSGFLAADNVTATYSRAAGETVAGSPYHITATLSPSGVLSNYNVTNNGADFTINKKNASWTTDPESKTYGDPDPIPLTVGSGTGFLSADNVTATYSRDPGETVAGSPYHITATLSATPSSALNNYNITNAGANFTIHRKPASITPNAASKTYGDADPALTGTLTGFLVADGVTATYSRAPGETVAGSPYTISATLSPAGVLDNYSITYNTANFTINKKVASVTPNAANKTYGDAEPAFTGTLTGFLAADGVTATYSRTPGETVAGSPYTISATLSPAGALGNYDITYNTANFTINKKTVSVTPNAASKTYGDADPAFTGTLIGFLAADGVTATYSRAPGETVAGSPYTISATLSPAGALGNYDITYNTANFTIDKKTASVTPNAASKTYGDADPAFTGTLTGFLAADDVTGTYSRAPGETVAGSPYTISATLSPAGVLGNYDITYHTAEFTINKKAASVTPNAKSKTYGDADPALTGTLTGFLATDGVTATYSRAPGETVAGSPYTISATLSPAGVLGNYDITYNTAEFTINKKTASVTPNAVSKTYGDADPALTGTLTGFLAADGVTGTYSRAPGETVAGSPYTISATLSPAGVLGNYDITYHTAEFTINKKTASVTPDAKSKTYGDADPALTGTLTGFVAADGVTATYSRAAGETVAGSPYTISATLSPAGVLGNYDITYNTANFAIDKKTASVTPDAKSKTYGDADPALTGTLTGFLATDGVTATHSRAPGETVAGSPYTISATLSPAGVLGNYDITYNTAEFTINKKTASVTPNAASKTYGDVDPVLTGTLVGFVVADGVTATYSRAPGETAAGSPYTISATLSPAGMLGNYDITYNTAEFTITTRPASVTPNAASKEYGAADPALTGTLSGFLAGDGVTASYSRTAGEMVAGGPYTISATLSPAAALSNYNITYNTADFTITTRPSSVTPNAASKEYGAADPALTGTLSGFLAGDGVTATYSRTAGETVAGGPYTISATLSPAAVLTNYSITYNTAEFTITTRPASVTPNAASKEYGAADPALIGTLTGFLAGDGVTATYSRTAGETVAGGPYTISATLSPAAVLGNYTITYNTASFDITARPASVTPNAASKVYGNADPAFTGTLSGFVAADGVTATYSRTSGETVAGSPYTISATLSPAGVLGNYTITYNTASFDITPRPASVTPDTATKVYGDADPVFTGTLSGFVAADGVTATYSRTAGETVAGSPYTISATLSPAGVLGNYTITYNTASFDITPRPASVTPDATSKIYGNADPVFTGTLSGFVAADGVTATYSRTSGETVAGSPYTISATLIPAAVLGNYTITYNTASFDITPRPASVTPDAASKIYGNADPAFTGVLSGFVAADGVTATYSRTAGETVAGSPYTISATLSPAAVLANYTITYNTASFNITPRPASVTPDTATKVYGDADPVFTGVLSGFVAADGVTATYSRTSGETVAGSPYTISATLSPAAVLGNYTITYNTASFNITPRPASVTPDTATKVYGDADPAFTGVLSGFVAADGVTATYSRTSGETVAGSPYTISATLSPAGVLSNYTITYNTANFTITPKAASVTPNAASKIYGSADPAFTGTLSGFLAGDGVTATYSRTSGETVAGSPYTISATLSPAGVLSNYNITYNTAAFTITPKSASMTPNPATKVYGSADPAFTGTLSGFLAADGVTATYSRTAGETVLGSPYTISATLSPVGVLSNYNITYNTAAFTITPKTASVTPNTASKTYGNVDPAFTGTLVGFLAADGVTAAYSRTAGESVAGSPYTISATLSPVGVLSNYTITYNTANFTINLRNATWTTNPNSKTYGTADPIPLTTGSGSNFVDPVTATYSRTAGETVAGSPYHITATLSAGTGVLANYNITNNGANFTINTATLTITAINRTKVFGATYTPDTTPPSVDFSVSGLVTGDSVASITLTCAGYPASALPGSPYTITPSAAVGTGLGNYAINYMTGQLTIGYGNCTGPNAGGVILPPINSDGTSVYKRQGGSTIPVKFTVCDANGNPVSDPNAVFAGTGGQLTMLSDVRGQVENINEVNGTDIPDAAFRWSGGIWIFNMTTQNLQSGHQYTFRINLKNGSGIQFVIGIK